MDNRKELKDYFNDIEEWENSFYCNCGYDTFEYFNYQRTVPNGEVWDCQNCGSELLVRVQPNEDDY